MVQLVSRRIDKVYLPICKKGMINRATSARVKYVNIPNTNFFNSSYKELQLNMATSSCHSDDEPLVLLLCVCIEL